MAIRGGKGEVLYYEGTIEDITKIKNTQKALLESEERYRKLFHRLPVGMYQSNLAGKILDVNETLVDMLGFSDKKSFLENEASFFYKDKKDRERFVEEFKKAKERTPFEVELNRKDGSTFWAKLIGQTVRDDKGEVLMFEGAVEDITERKMQELVLSESEKRFRGLFEIMKEGWTTVDKEGQFLEANRAFLDILGYTLAELRELTFMDITPLQYRERENKIWFEQVLKNGFSEAYEKEYIKKDQTKIKVEIRVYLLRDQKRLPNGTWAIIQEK